MPTLSLDFDPTVAESAALGVTILLNGDPYDLPGPLSVSELLARLKLDPRRVAVEHNLMVVKRARYDETVIRERDRIEVVNFVGGGWSRT